MKHQTLTTCTIPVPQLMVLLGACLIAAGVLVFPRSIAPVAYVGGAYLFLWAFTSYKISDENSQLRISSLLLSRTIKKDQIQRIAVTDNPRSGRVLEIHADNNTVVRLKIISRELTSSLEEFLDEALYGPKK